MCKGVIQLILKIIKYLLSLIILIFFGLMLNKFVNHYVDTKQVISNSIEKEDKVQLLWYNIVIS